MSLFRKVFNTHNEPGVSPANPAPIGAAEEDDFVFEDALDADIADVMVKDPPVQTPVEHVSAPAPEAKPAPPTAAKVPNFETAEAPPTPPAPAEPPATLAQRARALDPALVERAARAQSEIEETQQRRMSAPTPAPEVDNATIPSGAPAEPEAGTPAATAAPPPKRARGGRRVRTRMLGFDQGADVAPDPFEAGSAAPAAAKRLYPVAWVVVAEGPGDGHSFALYAGVSTIGRGTDQTVTLDFGDTSISREKHAAIAYDDESKAFYLGHGGKSNIVRLNGRPVLSTEDLTHGDTIKIGETTLRFVALCGSDFTWGTPKNA